jgi:hypothetical protein
MSLGEEMNKKSKRYVVSVMIGVLTVGATLVVGMIVAASSIAALSGIVVGGALSIATPWTGYTIIVISVMTECVLYAATMVWLCVAATLGIGLIFDQVMLREAPNMLLTANS